MTNGPRKSVHAEKANAQLSTCEMGILSEIATEILLDRMGNIRYTRNRE